MFTELFSSCNGSSSMKRPLASLPVLFGMLCLAPMVVGQDKDFKTFDTAHVFDQLDSQSAAAAAEADTSLSWWDEHVARGYRREQPMPADIHSLLFLALRHSNNIKIAKRDPLIRETAVTEADSNFDWVRYVDSSFSDTSQPVGNSLTAGGTVDTFDDSIFQLAGGVRKLTRYGGILDISQRFGFQDNNSVFLVPNDQATSQFTVSYTHPLLRGRGQAFNNSLVFLAQVDSEVADQEFLATLQDELLEITRVYWALYQERAVLAHRMRLYLETQQIYTTLNARRNVDTQGTQLTVVSSALENRRSDLIRARTAVTNAETRLRGLINAPELGNSDEAELIPAEAPVLHIYQSDLQTEIQSAVRNRPEIAAALRQVRAGSIRLGVAEHELLPALNLVTQTFLNGLRGDSQFAEAFGDQFVDGRPSYTIGIQYELPVGNRLARARVCRRQHELAQLQDQYARALETVKTEVDIAVRELHTSYQEIGAKRRALAAAEAEANTIEQRWKRSVDGDGSGGLNLESLLRAQERVTAQEAEYVNSVLTYNLAMINLKRSNGTLLQSQAVNIAKGCDDRNGTCRSIELTKGHPAGGNVVADGSCTTGCSDCGGAVVTDYDYGAPATTANTLAPTSPVAATAPASTVTAPAATAAPAVVPHGAIVSKPVAEDPPPAPIEARPAKAAPAKATDMPHYTVPPLLPREPYVVPK